MITAIRRIIAKVTGLLTLTGCQNMCRRRKLIPANASALTTAKTGAVAIVIPMITAATSELPMSSHCADVLFTGTSVWKPSALAVGRKNGGAEAPAAQSDHLCYPFMYETHRTGQAAARRRTTGVPSANAGTGQRALQLAQRTGVATEKVSPFRFASRLLLRGTGTQRTVGANGHSLYCQG